MLKTDTIIREKITDFVNSDRRNSMADHDSMKIYDPPIIGTAAADDPMFGLLRGAEAVGPQFVSPKEWLPSARSVVSFFLPFSEQVRASNRVQGMVSQEWASARIAGESFINELKLYIANFMQELGYYTVIPSLDPRFCVKIYTEGQCKASNWSERHVAHIAGIGTFGLHKALITAKGSAGRLGSVVTSLALPPTPRTYSGVFDYCPHITRGTCGACISRCPVCAISRAGKDKIACSRYIDDVIKPKFAPRYGCAKCNTAVPCEFAIPGV